MTEIKECSCCYDACSSDKKNPAVTCQFCDFTVCRNCQKTYTLGMSTEMHCMSCKKEWSNDHIFENFTKTFVNTDLKKHRENILVESQQILLPTTQESVKYYKKGKQLVANFEEEVVNSNNIKTQERVIRNSLSVYEETLDVLHRVQAFDIEEYEIKEILEPFMDNIGKLCVNGKYRCSRSLTEKKQIWELNHKFLLTVSGQGSITDDVRALVDAMDRSKMLSMIDKYKYLERTVNTIEDYAQRRVWRTGKERFDTTYVFDTKTCKSYINGDITLDQALDDIRGIIEKKNTEIDDLRRSIVWEDPYGSRKQFLTKPIEFLSSEAPNVVKTHAWTWSCPCEECKGFLDTKHVCGTCDKKFCKDCNVEMQEDEEHVCDKDTRLTVTMLKRDSKPCPNCRCVIHKIDGCDQMWCPDCKSAFSWKNGTIETRIHNPHYYQYLRDTQGHVPREPADQPDRCEEEEDNDTLLERFHWQHDRVIAHPTYGKVWRVLLHARHMTRRGQWGPQNLEDRQRLWRVQYMLGEMTEQKWKRNLQKLDKDARKRAEICNVLDTYVQLGCDIIRDKAGGNLDLDDKVKRHKKIALYFSNIFIKISTQYNCVVPYFTEDCLNIVTLKH